MRRGKVAPQVPDSRSFGTSLADSGFLVMPCDDTETQIHGGQGRSPAWSLSPPGTHPPLRGASSQTQEAWSPRLGVAEIPVLARHSLTDAAGRPAMWRAPLHVLRVLKGAEHAALSPMGRQGCQGWGASVTKRCACGLSRQPCCVWRGTHSPDSDRAGPGDVRPAQTLHLSTPCSQNGGRSRAGSRVHRAGSTVQAPHTCMDERLSSQPWVPGLRVSGGPWLNLRSDVLCETFSPGPSSSGAVGVRATVP